VPSLLDHPVESLPGIGATTGARLRERGLATVGDLLWLLPRGYDDQREPTLIHELRDGEYAVVEGIVRSSRSFPRGSKVGFHARVEPIDGPIDGDGYRELKLVWFSAIPGLGRRFAQGNRVRVAGRVQDYRGTATLAHPETLSVDVPGAIEARYPEVPGVRRKILRKAIQAAVDRAAGELADLVPEALRSEVEVVAAVVQRAVGLDDALAYEVSEKAANGRKAARNAARTHAAPEVLGGKSANVK